MAGPAVLPPRVDGARLADDFTIRKVGASKREGFNKHEGKDLAPVYPGVLSPPRDV